MYDQRGSFTVEATFVSIISIAVIMALLYALLFYTDCVFIESKVRRAITEEYEMENCKGVLGEGTLKKQVELDIFSSEYQLQYQIPNAFPLTKEYLEKEFFSYAVIVKNCDREEAEFIRLSEAIKSRE